MKIGEIVSASVLDGLTAKLMIPDPEELRVGFGHRLFERLS